MKKIILAFDSFKGSASSTEISSAAKRAILSESPDCEVISVPIADGGEGTTQAICYSLSVSDVACEVHDPLMNIITSHYAITGDGKTAIMEMAVASGLPLIPKEKRNPLFTTSTGTGEMIADAIRRGCTKIVLGIGGSATNDAATGLLSALGVIFYDKEKNIIIPNGKALNDIYDFDASSLDKYRDIEFVVACDVKNPLFGEDGAAFVYGPQKGASTTDVIELDKGLRNFNDVIYKRLHIDISTMPGSGAAGGMGAGLSAFLNAKLMSGIDTILTISHFSELLDGADLVITGEGKIDSQTNMGKALDGILSISKQKGVPVIAIAGSIENISQLNERGFAALFCIQQSPVSLEDAMKKEITLKNIGITVSQIIRTIKYLS